MQAAIDFMDGDHAAEIFYRARMAEIEYADAEDEAYLSLEEGSVETKKRRARQVPRVRQLARDFALAEAEQVRLKHKWEKADAVIRLYRDESFKSRMGNI